MTIGVAFVLGMAAAWALARLARAIAFGGSKVGSNARARWLAKMDYETLIRTKTQIEDEIAKRQPGRPETTYQGQGS